MHGSSLAFLTTLLVKLDYHAALQLTEHPEDGAAVVRLLPLDLRDAPVEAAPSVAGDCRCHRGRGRR